MQLIETTQIDALVSAETDPAVRERKRIIADHLLAAPKEYYGTIYEVFSSQGIPAGERAFVDQILGLKPVEHPQPLGKKPTK